MLKARLKSKSYPNFDSLKKGSYNLYKKWKIKKKAVLTKQPRTSFFCLTKMFKKIVSVLCVNAIKNFRR